jgi:enoyl-CoA hydratase
MILGGQRVDAARALQIGLAQEVVPRGHALERALELANTIASYPQPGLLADRAGAHEASPAPTDDGLRREFERGYPVLSDPDVAQRIRR